MKHIDPQHLIVGRKGEEFTASYLRNRGFCIVTRNYWKPCGEIDIVVEKNGILHFVEVKTVTREKAGDSVNPVVEPYSKGKSLLYRLFCRFFGSQDNESEPRAHYEVNRETLDGYDPEDNMHIAKQIRLSRVIRAYLAENGAEEKDYVVDLACVYLDKTGKMLKIDYVDDITLM